MGRKLQLAMEVVLAMVSALTSTGAPSHVADETTRQHLLDMMRRAGVAIAEDFGEKLSEYDVPGAADGDSEPDQQAMRTRTMRQVVNFYKAQLVRRDWRREPVGPESHRPDQPACPIAQHGDQPTTGVTLADEAALGHHPKIPDWA